MSESESSPSLLIAGCGYLGIRVAERWQSDGGKVHAITRSSTKAEQFTASGWTPILVDLANPTLVSLPPVDYVFWAVGFLREGGTDRRRLWIDGLNWLIQSLPGSTRRFIYTSSTSVYGQVADENVTEETPAEPVTEGGKVCLEAEQIVNDVFEDRGTCLRMAGIYGPDRLLRRISDLRKQKPLVGEADHWLNLIHVDDAAGVVCHLLPSNDRLPSVINVANRPAVNRQTYYSQLAELSQAPPPVFGGSSGTGRHRSGNKQVDTLYRDLFPKLAYDDVLAGLRDAYQNSQH